MSDSLSFLRVEARRNWGAAVVFGAVLALFGGCGGKVVLEPGEGTGGMGSSSSGMTSSGSSGNTSGSSSGGTVKSDCELICEALIQNGCSDQSCADACVQESTKPVCGERFSEWIHCSVQNLGSIMGCTLPFECAAIEQSYFDCTQMTGCDNQTCGMGSDGSCFCGAQCNGIYYESQCYTDPGGTSTCVCNINGMPVEKCADAKPICDIQSNCCAGVFFGNGGKN